MKGAYIDVCTKEEDDSDDGEVQGGHDCYVSKSVVYMRTEQSLSPNLPSARLYR
jgi:hypothetical protein